MFVMVQSPYKYEKPQMCMDYSKIQLKSLSLKQLRCLDRIKDD